MARVKGGNVSKNRKGSVLSKADTNRLKNIIK